MVARKLVGKNGVKLETRQLQRLDTACVQGPVEHMKDLTCDAYKGPVEHLLPKNPSAKFEDPVAQRAWLLAGSDTWGIRTQTPDLAHLEFCNFVPASMCIRRS
eukprot:1161943-Pelagomonas_calceolata.AAC.5